ncbi:MAG: TIGR02391 family protein [Candidatus Thiodiazotropha taylori]
MIGWYLEINRVLREIRKKSLDAANALKNEDAGAAKVINGYLKTDYANLRRLWEEHYEPSELGYLGRHIGFGDPHDYDDILNRDLPHIEDKAEQHLLGSKEQPDHIGFEYLLHPVIFEHAYQQFRAGHLRDSVLNSFTAVFDLIRERTGLDMDGAKLASQVFSVKDPCLILSEIETESGRNDQAGFLQIYQGAYVGIRNPKAHSLQHDLTEEKAAQYLVFASLLARRVADAYEP